jgi:CII-binding regulator of phage lambda lysogenization HflD
MKPPDLSDAKIIVRRWLFADYPIRHFIDNRFECLQGAGLRSRVGWRQTGGGQKLVAEHPR